MAEFRNIDMFLDATKITEIAQITGHAALNQALGYLMQWNLTYPYLRIAGGVYGGNPELIASYKSHALGNVEYAIGAVWHDDHFGFHS